MLLFTVVLLALFSRQAFATSPNATIQFSYVPNVHIGNTRLVNKLTVTVNGDVVVDPIRSFAQILLTCDGTIAYSAAVALNTPFSIPTVMPPSVCELLAAYNDNGQFISVDTNFPFSVIPFAIKGKYILDGTDLVTTFSFINE